MDKHQERCIELLDGLVERGVDLQKLSKELPEKEYANIRKRASRAFGSYKNALIAFGLFDEVGTPTEIELYRCFYIDDFYKVQVNQYERDRVLVAYNLSEVRFKSLTRELLYELKKDALDEFYRNEFPDNLKHAFMERSEYKHLWSYMQSLYGGLQNFLEAYGTPSHIFVTYDYDRWNGDSIQNGHTFEALVKEVLESLHNNVKYHSLVNGCRPDFIVDSRWLDAKLSYSTVIHPRSTVIDRYTAQTDDLTIIYAKRPRKPFVHNEVKFIHISEFYDDLTIVGNVELVDRIKSFVSNVNESEAVS